MTEQTKDNKRVINGWAFFDWANSSYSLVISTAIFPIYFISITSEEINIFGNAYSNSVVFSYLVSACYIIVAIFSPLLGGISDYGDKRMTFLRFFSTIGGLACILLFFFRDSTDVILGCAAFGIATIGHASSLIFYDAYLPEISSKENMDKVSARGYAFGYVGSVLLLLFIIFMSLKPALFGIPPESSLPYRIGFALVGFWWIGFSQITFRRLPKGSRTKMKPSILKNGYIEIKTVFKELLHRTNLMLFLVSFFFYSAGVQTVIYVATIFAKKELSFETNELIITVLLLQLVAIAGAFLFAYISKIRGNKFSLTVAISIWAIITICAYFVQGKMIFYGLVFMVGLVLGGVQALSRSTYSKLLGDQTEDLTSYFSFYDVLYYVSVVFGTFMFGLIETLTNNLRYSVLALGFFFIIGLVMLQVVNFKNTLSTPKVAVQ